MKKFEELTELELSKLSDEQVDFYIKQKKAENGIKFIDFPQEPNYHEIKEPKNVRFYISLFGTNITFDSYDDANKVVELLKGMELKSVEYDWKNGDRIYFEKPNLKSVDYNSSDPFQISTIYTYTKEEHDEVKELISLNKKMKEEYKKAVKDWEENEEKAKPIVEEIFEKVNNAKEKYQRLNNLSFKLATEYLPLANNDLEVALNFLKKAYVISKEDEKYILENYKNYIVEKQNKK